MPCWIEAKVLRPEAQAFIFSIPGVWREAEFNGTMFKIVSVDWILEHCSDARSRAWFEGMSTAFDYDNFKGRMEGQLIYRNS